MVMATFEVNGMRPVDRRTALVAVDLMDRLVQRRCTPHHGVDVVERTLTLAHAVRGAGGLVVWLRSERPGPEPQPMGSELAAAIVPAAADLLVVKQAWGAFHTTDLDERLRARDISSLWLTGIATNLGVESTARCANELGYQLVCVEDTMSGLDAGAHQHCVEAVLPRLGAVASHAELLAGSGLTP